jgi:predicted dehydrogenase
MSDRVLLVGVGFMGKAYAPVLGALGASVQAVGRSEAGAVAFEAETGVTCVAGGLKAWRALARTVPRQALVCVSVEETPVVVKALAAMGVERMLIEKPGASSAAELQALCDEPALAKAEIFVAYNRRYYASVAEARRRIQAEGGVDSFHFEFTERERDANPAKFGETVRRNWALANSSHVIDLAFHLGGEPCRLNSEVAGSLDWHPGGARFVGSGVSNQDALFTYTANWTSGGRWAVELMTRESRLILRPLEQLFVQQRGSFEVKKIEVDDELDKLYKPGLYRQLEAFLHGGDGLAHLLNLRQQSQHATRFYGPMAGEVSP